jgi:tRNA (mo5U34)-methyltransferase
MFSAMRKRRAVQQVGYWWHSIDLGDGVVTPGFKTPELLANELQAIDMPEDLMGRSVLDVGTWDGFYAFEAERRGARRVVVVDHFVWSGDITALQSGEWDPKRLPGKRGFDLAHDTLQSNVEVVVADFMTMDTDALGIFDVVLYLGVLYHMEDPMRALRRLCGVTGGVAIIETEAIVIPGFEHTPMWRFFPGAELNSDSSNWWAPNLSALTGALDAVGFHRVEVKVGPPPALLEAAGGPHHYRAIVHAFKDQPTRVM